MTITLLWRQNLAHGGRICAIEARCLCMGASLVAQKVKRLPAMQETWVWSLDQEDSLEKETATITEFDTEWVSESCSVVSNSLRSHGLYSPWNSPGQNTGVGSLSLLQEIFPTQGSNPGLPHCRQILYQLSHKGSAFYLYSAFFSCTSKSYNKNKDIL